MPQDDLGLVRNDIVSVERTSGTGQPGSVDTYTITMRSGATFTFTITNGANGGTGGVQKLEFTTVSNFTDWYIAASTDLSKIISIAYFDADYNSMLCFLDNSGSTTKLYKMLPNGTMQELNALSSGEKIVVFYKLDESTQIDTALNENSVNPVQNKAIVEGIKNATKYLENFQYGLSHFEFLRLNKEHNLIDPLNAVNNHYWNGYAQSNSGYYYVKVPVVAGTRYNFGILIGNIGKSARFIEFYDENNTRLSTAQNILSAVAPTGAVYAYATYSKEGNENNFLKGCTFYADETEATNSNDLKYTYFDYQSDFLKIHDKNFLEPISPKNIYDLAIDYNLFDQTKLVTGYLNSTGYVYPNENYKTSDYIKVENGKTYIVNVRTRFLRMSANKGVEEYILFVESQAAGYTFTASQDGYVRFTIYNGDNLSSAFFGEKVFYDVLGFKPYNNKMFGNSFILNTNQLEQCEEVAKDALLAPSKNLYDYTKDVSGFLQGNNTITESTSYETSEEIKVYAGKTYILSQRARKFGVWRKDGTLVIWEDEAVSAGYSFTASYDGFARFTFYVSDGVTKAMFVEGNEIPNDFIPFGPTNKENIWLSKQQIEQVKSFQNLSGSVLYGKKYVSCGDSFTADGWGGVNPEYISGGMYDGQLKVYPYIIGNRTNAIIIQKAAGGMTLATYSGGTNCFTYNNYYQSIPEDADYITLYFGINDSHQHVPIGTIDDNTTDTFYGAWNVVLQWLITNRPNAHIGVIVSNGCDTTEYPIATIAACKKWGVAYLDINGDDKLPYVVRANMRTNLSDTARTIYDNYLMVAPGTNGHPNGLAHEKESYMIQQFLERL